MSMVALALIAGCSGDASAPEEPAASVATTGTLGAGQGIDLASTGAGAWIVGDRGFGAVPPPIEGFSQLTMDTAVNYSKSLLTYGHVFPETVFGQSTATFDAGVLPGNREFIAQRAPGVDTPYFPGTWLSQFGPGVIPAGDVRVNGRWTVSRKDFGATPNMSLLWEGTFAYPVTYNGVTTTVAARRFLRANWVNDPASTPGLNARGTFLNVDTCALQTEHRWFFPATDTAAAESLNDVIANPYEVEAAEVKSDDQLERFCPTPSATPTAP